AALQDAWENLTAPAVLVGLGVQLGLLAAAVGLAVVLRWTTRDWTDRLLARADLRLRPPRLMAALRRVATPALALLLIAVAYQVSLALLRSAELVRAAANLLLAWLI